MGTTAFAVESLKALVGNHYNVVGVITAPDRRAGRGQKIMQSAIKEYALSVNLPILQPEKLTNPDFLKELQDLQADLQIVVAFRMLPGIIFNMPRLGSFNLHASLLPQYRGAAPINRAIMNGEKKTGVTTFFLQHEIDAGNIINQFELPISDEDTAGTLHDKLMVLGANLVLKTISDIEDNMARDIPQHRWADCSQLKAAPKIYKEDCRINWNENAEKIRNHIRGLSPYPAAWTHFITKNGKPINVKIYKAEVNHSEILKPGSIVSDRKDHLLIGTSEEALKIHELQAEGKKRMSISDFLRGFDIKQIIKVE